MASVSALLRCVEGSRTLPPWRELYAVIDGRSSAKRGYDGRKESVFPAQLILGSFLERTRCWYLSGSPQDPKPTGQPEAYRESWSRIPETIVSGPRAALRLSGTR